MSLTAFTGTVDDAVYNPNFNDHTAATTSQAVEGQVDMSVHHKVVNLTTTPGVTGLVDFTPEDDMEARVLRVRGEDAAGGMTVTAFLEVANGDTTFLLDKTISVTTAALGAGAGGAKSASLDLRTVTGDRLRLLKGVPYRLRLVAGSGSVDDARVMLVLRTIRRIA